MGMTAALIALALSALLLGTAIALLMMLRRGDGPVYSASRAYDQNRREALRLLLGREVATVPREQWFLRERREPTPGDPLEPPYREAVAEALRVLAPRLEDAALVPAISTADLRASGILEAHDGPGLVIGLVLVNPEPPGGDARRVTLPIQVLFSALERAGRGDLVRRFADLRDRAAMPPATLEAR